MTSFDRSTLRLLAALSTVTIACLLLWQFYYSTAPDVLIPRVHNATQSHAFSEAPIVPCIDPLGNPASTLIGTNLSDHEFPPPTYGSFDALDLPKTWMTFAQRYGSYGFGNEALSAELGKADWGALQTRCLKRNHDRFPGQQVVDVLPPRFRLAEHESLSSAAPIDAKSNRQAIVLRTWSSYHYHEEDLWNLRSIVSEASLATGAEYQVFLLVDVKEEDSRVHEDDEEYERVLKESVPEEFRSITVLWHHSLLESWYKKVLEHRPFWQIMQPFQLFAHFYPEFDHYWQFEMDTRFTGDVGQLLRSFDNFSRQQPYKQARERASWTYMSSAHGTYAEFSNNLNATLKGSSPVWGPLEVKEVNPISPLPPGTAEDDDFSWGLGTDADLLLLGPLNDVRRFEQDADWVFRNWYFGFAKKGIPRFMSVPAQARASWELLEAIHQSQHRKGLRVASEATLPSFALWNGLKVVGIPLPKYQHPQRDLKELDFVQNGGKISDFGDGVANGPGKYRSSSLSFFSRPVTFDWWSSLCSPVFDRWRGVEDDKTNALIASDGQGPRFMAHVNGSLYLPSLLFHPRKTSSYRGPER